MAPVCFFHSQHATSSCIDGFRCYSRVRKEYAPVRGTSMTVFGVIYIITSSAIIEDVEGMRAAGLATMAYYYFDFRDNKKQGSYGLLSSLLSQLSAELDSCYEVLSRLYSDNAGGTRKPTGVALTRCMKDMLSLSGQDPIYIIIDASMNALISRGDPRRARRSWS